LVWELDRKAFELSCQAAATLRRVKPEQPFFMSCNFSALSIVQPAFLQEVMGAVARNGMAAKDFCIEITESTAFEAGEVAMTALRELHALGFVLALDDFGTGYSSLAHLRDLPLSTVKVDRSFVSRLERGTTERAITEAVVHLARTLNLSVVAEGVETIEQLRQVRELGFRFIQGFYYSPARPLSENLLAL
jgi:EAL domain-containing protein (putative c-di-GMP-specific phosphodiesterase class I)